MGEVDVGGGRCDEVGVRGEVLEGERDAPRGGRPTREDCLALWVAVPAAAVGGVAVKGKFILLS